jgi:hypothetical protein
MVLELGFPFSSLSLSHIQPSSVSPAAGVTRRRRAAGSVSGRRPVARATRRPPALPARPVARATRRPPSPPRPVVASAVGARPSGLRPSRPARPCACSARRACSARQGPLAPAPAPSSGLCSIRPRLLSPPRFQPSASIWPEPVAAPAPASAIPAASVSIWPEQLTSTCLPETIGLPSSGLR